MASRKASPSSPATCRSWVRVLPCSRNRRPASPVPDPSATRGAFPNPVLPRETGMNDVAQIEQTQNGSQRAARGERARRKGHKAQNRPPFECIALLLQGGGALGA